MRYSTEVWILVRSKQLARSDANGRHIQDIQLHQKYMLIRDIRYSRKKTPFWWDFKYWLQQWPLHYQDYIEHLK